MRRIFFLLLCMLVFEPALSREPSRDTLSSTPTPTPTLLDTLLSALILHYDSLAYRTPAEISSQIYLRGTSIRLKPGLPTRFLRHFVPFECSADTSVFEAILQASYRYPYELQIESQAFRGSKRYSKQHMKEVFQTLLPLYNVVRPRSNGGRNALIHPFSSDGLSRYHFDLSDTLTLQGEPCCWIRFRPKKRHHALLQGYIVTSRDGNRLFASNFECLVDFAKAEISLNFDNVSGEPRIRQSHIELTYNYMGARGINSYDCFYDYKNVIWLNDIDPDTLSLDVTDHYAATQLPETAFDSLRPQPLPAFMAHALDSAEEERRWEEIRKQKNVHIDEETHEVIDHDEDRGFSDFMKKLPERLIATSHYDVFGSDLKLYGPLEPSCFGYDHLNGFTFRFRAFLKKRFKSGKRFSIRPEVGYAFGRREFRYTLSADWIHHPATRQGIRFWAAKRQATFPTAFKDIVNEAIKASDNTDVDFDKLGIDYYNHHEFRLEHSWELYNGLMLYGGLDFNYRSPRRHGTHAMSKERIESLVQYRYSDLAPYIRLVWTPHQYYRYEQGEKLYIETPYPTFEAEFMWGKNLHGMHTSFGRLEFDIHQAVRIDPLRTFSYHAGFGHFFHRSGTPFFNYRYFSRSEYPDSWDERIGGTFSLLDDYWFASTPAYIQLHSMYETPFFLLHHWRLLSRYVIRERVYASLLLADSKPTYTEFGYGFGNNYFSIAGFIGFNGVKYNRVGIKFQLVLGKHL